MQILLVARVGLGDDEERSQSQCSRVAVMYASCVGWTEKKGIIEKVEMPGIEPGASRMRSERSTTELHPQLGRRMSNVHI